MKLTLDQMKDELTSAYSKVDEKEWDKKVKIDEVDAVRQTISGVTGAGVFLGA